MKTSLRITICNLIATSTMLIASANAQDGSLQASGALNNQSAGRVLVDNTIGQSKLVPFGPLVRLSNFAGDGQGWAGNLWGGEVFVPWHLDPGQNLIFLSAGGYSDDDGKGVGNFVGGYRFRNGNQIITLGGTFDVDDGPNNTYTRAGFNASVVGPHLGLHVNGAIVTSDDSNVIASGILPGASFTGNNILFNNFRTTEFAYNNLDVLVGGPLPFLGENGVDAYFGAHWLNHSDTTDTVGVDMRIQAWLNEDATVGVQVGYDDIFGWNTFVQTSIALPNGQSDGWMKHWFRKPTTRSRMGDALIRNPRIPVNVKQEILGQVLALDTRDGLPYNIFYINQGAGGTGTVENPAGSLAFFQALPQVTRDSFDAILVNGNNFALTNTLQLGVGQRLLSTAITQTALTNLGTATLPGTGTGIFPTITNAAGGNLISLANINELSAFIFDGGGTGRPVVANGILGFNINNSVFQNSVDHGIALVDATGTFATGAPGLLNTNTFQNNPGDGFQLVNNNPAGGTLDFGLFNNVASGNGAGAAGIGFHIQAHNSNVINADAALVAGTGITGNTASNNGSGLSLETTTGGIIFAGLANNTFTNNTDMFTGASFNATGAGSQIHIGSLSNNNFDLNDGYGMSATAATGATITINNAFGNTFNDNDLGGLLLRSNGAGSLLTANIGGNGASQNVFKASSNGAGIELSSSNGSLFAAFTNNQIGSVGGFAALGPNATYGVFANLDGGSSGITLDNNTISSNGLVGIANVNANFSNTFGAPVTASFISRNNSITNGRAGGMSITNNGNNTNLSINILNDTITGNGQNADGSGLVISNLAMLSNGEVDFNITNTNISDNLRGSGLVLTTANSSTLNGTITGSAFNRNGSITTPGNGLQANIEGAASVLNLTVTKSQFDSNFDNAAVGSRTSGSGLQFNVNKVAAGSSSLGNVLIGLPAGTNQITNNSGAGIEILTGNLGRVVNFVADSNNISNNLEEGVFLSTNMTGNIASPFTASFMRNTINSNGMQGLSADFRGFLAGRTAPAVLNITTANLISNNGREGIRVITDTDRVRPTTLGVNAVTNNHGGGAVIPLDPNDALFAAQLGAGTFLPSPRGRFLSTLEDIAVNLNVKGNTITTNGQSAIAANDDGLAILVGTGSYIAADIQNNRIENSIGVDFSTGSFLSAGNTPTSTNMGGIDTVTLDDTAMLDLRFLGNQMNRINASSQTTAFFTDADAAKNFTTPNPWTFAGDAFNNRPAFFYRVDQSGLLDASNVINDGGVPASAAAAFTAGRYNLDPAMVFGSATFAADQPLP